MELDIIFKIAGIGILTAVLQSVLKSVGKEELAGLATLSGLAVVLYMVIDLLSELFVHVRAVFMLY